MKKNNIKILVLTIVLTLTLVGCQPADKNLNRLSTQTRITERNMDSNTPLNKRDGVNNLNTRNNNLNDRFMNNDGLMNPGTNKDKLNNGMIRNTDDRMNPDTNLSTDMTNMTGRATTIAERVMALPEIDDASVLITGNTAIVGCDVKGDSSNKITNALKTKVEAAVKVADRNVQKVSVTSDPSIYKRIQTMTKDMNRNTTMENNPVSRFTKDIEDILKDITNMK